MHYREDVDYLERAKKLAPEVGAFAAETERECRVPDALMDKLHDAGMFRLQIGRAHV